MPILAPLDAKELPFTVQRPANEMRERVVQRGERIRREEKRPRPWSERKERKRDGPDKEGGPSGRSGASSAPLHELEESYVRELINK